MNKKEKKNLSKPIFPTTWGIPENRCSIMPVEYHICKDGFYISKKVMGDSIVTFKIDSIPNIGSGKEIFDFNMPKIPIDYFWETINFFKYVSSEFGQNLEAYVVIGYNTKEGDFCIYIPEQEVTPASVQYDLTKFYTENPGYSIILDIHSHGSIGAFFSGIDDNNDKNDRFSGVIGYLNKLIPEYKFRFSSMGKYFDLTLDDIFCSKIEPVHINYREEIKKIKLRQREQGYILEDYGVTFRDSEAFRGCNLSDIRLFDSIKHAFKNGYTLKDLVGESFNE